MKRIFLLLSPFLLSLAFFSGCGEVKDDDDTELPWTEPEDWEQQLGPFMTQ